MTAPRQSYTPTGTRDLDPPEPDMHDDDWHATRADERRDREDE